MSEQRERLIELIKQKSCIGYNCVDDCLKCNRCAITKPDAELIADWLLANGVIVPPCKVGDVVYKPIITDDTHEPAIWDIEITQISIEVGKLLNEGYAVGKICKGESGDSFDFDEIGKTVFPTKEEVLQALQELKARGEG